MALCGRYPGLWLLVARFASRRHLCGAVLCRNDALDELHVDEYARVRRCSGAITRERLDTGRHSATGGRRNRCRCRHVVARIVSTAARRNGARPRRFPPFVPRCSMSYGRERALVIATRRECRGGDLRAPGALNPVRVAPNLARYALDARFLQAYGQFIEHRP